MNVLTTIIAGYLTGTIVVAVISILNERQGYGDANYTLSIATAAIWLPALITAVVLELCGEL